MKTNPRLGLQKMIRFAAGLLGALCVTTAGGALPEGGPVTGTAGAGMPGTVAGGDEAPATRAYWVFFHDRGSQTLDEETMRARAAELSPEVWARRMRGERAPVPDERDLPLWEPYVREVAAHGTLRHQSRSLNAVSIDVAPDALASLEELSFVADVRPVAVAVRTSIGPGVDPATGEPLGEITDPVRRSPSPQRAGRDLASLDYGQSLGQLTEITVPAVHALGFTGNRVRFMMIDTGFRKDHEVFADTELFDEWDFIFGDGETQNEPDDDPNQHKHGTTTWSVAGGFAPGILIGAGFGSSFALAKTEDIRSETRVEEDYYVAALEWADQLGVSVTNASLGYICFDSGFCYEFEDKDGDTAVITVAIDIAAERGILCVNSQGNSGCDIGSLSTPADADSMLAVGAVDSVNVIAPFSACGPTFDDRIKPEVVARGRETFAASGNEQNTYGHTGGTSLSSPLVAGAAALLIEAHPEWGPMDVRAAMLATADRAGSPDNTYGWGRIDTEAALFYTPLLHPYPFSLASPEDGAMTTLGPDFTWHPSIDPQGGPLTYTLHIEEAQTPGNFWDVPAGSDTLLTLPFLLTPDTEYRWEVYAETGTGYRRISRETFTLFTPPATDVAEELGPRGARSQGGLLLRLATNPVREELRFTVQLPEASNTEAASAPLTWGLYDPTGRRLLGGAREARSGVYEVALQPSAADGPIPRGVYYLEVRVAHRAAREAVILLGD